MLKILPQIKSELEKELKQYIDRLVLHEALKKPLKYALINSGKKIRPILILLIAKALDQQFDVMPAAFACEFFHVASLIADDLPCMDDDAIRRGKKSLHVAFDEETALLTSYGLISLAFQEIHRNFTVMKQTVGVGPDQAGQALDIALHQACYFSGFSGAVSGQYFDLKQKTKNLEASQKINESKTGALFCGTFVLGWIFGGGAIEKLDELKKAAGHFGAAFQIYDDIKDEKNDRQKKSLANIAIILGQREAKRKCREHIEKFKALFSKLVKEPSLLNNLIDLYFKKAF